MIRDLGQLQAFLAIVQHGSVGRAAEALCITQSALIRIIQRLEEQIGAPLFERHTRGMTLTSYGVALEPYATHLVAESANAMNEIDAMRGLRKGVVRVGTVASALETILPSAIDRLLLQWPGLQISITEGITDELAVMLAKSDIDIAVAFTLSDPEDLALVSESAWQEGCHVVAGVGHPLHGKRLGLADLAGERWVLTPGRMGPREEWQQVFRAGGLEPPQPAVETRSVSAMRSLITRCGFLGWMPDALVSASGTANGIRPLLVEGAHVPRYFAVYRRRHGILSAPAARLIEELRYAVEALPGRPLNDSISV